MKTNAGMILLVMLLGVVFCVAGCSSSTIIGQGETAAEGHRRHLRQLELARQQIADDIDAVMLTDQPTKLSDMRIR
jgi:outer membrane murein-binding lipoprotein Lpp